MASPSSEQKNLRLHYAKRKKEKEAQNGDAQAQEKTSQEQAQEEVVEAVAKLLCFFTIHIYLL
jgi:hypothetical protein